MPQCLNCFYSPTSITEPESQGAMPFPKRWNIHCEKPLGLITSYSEYTFVAPPPSLGLLSPHRSVHSRNLTQGSTTNWLLSVFTLWGSLPAIDETPFYPSLLCMFPPLTANWSLAVFWGCCFAYRQLKQCVFYPSALISLSLEVVRLSTSFLTGTQELLSLPSP